MLGWIRNSMKNLKWLVTQNYLQAQNFERPQRPQKVGEDLNQSGSPDKLTRVLPCQPVDLFALD